MNSVRFRIDGGDWVVPDAFYRISIKLILKNDRDELLVMCAHKDDLYELPGGGLDWDETHEQTARRELKEELDLKLEAFGPEPLVTEYSQHPLGFHAIKVYYRVTVNGDPVDNEPELFAHSWVTKEQFTGLKMPGDESPIQKHVEKIWQ